MVSSSDAGEEIVPANQEELARWMTGNATGTRRKVFPLGGGTALGYGFPIVEPGVRLSTRSLTQIIDYPARDMTITVEAGVRVADLQRTLATERQRLAVDVAQAGQATLGGVIATNTSGPRRFGLGTMRDYVIGISAVDAAGRAYKAGGRVVKNVAGYDLCKMLVGSLGTLSVITQVTLKLKPLPESSRLVWLSFENLVTIDQVLEKLLTSETRPVALEVLDPRGAAMVAGASGVQVPGSRPVLVAGFEGTAREVQWQMDKLLLEVRPYGPLECLLLEEAASSRVWQGLTEFAVTTDAALTFQAQLLPSKVMSFLAQAEPAGAALQAHAGNGVIVGHLPRTVHSGEEAEDVLAPLRALTRRAGGNLVVLQCADRWKQAVPVFGERDASWALMQTLKQHLDPQGILNPGRFVDH